MLRGIFYSYLPSVLCKLASGLYRPPFGVGQSGADPTPAVGEPEQDIGDATARIAAKAGPIINCLYFDSIGVPSPEQMIAEFGSGENWQRAKTFDWMIRIQEEFLSKGKLVLFDGKMRISFIFEACAAAKITNYKTILVDCDDASRESRLRINRRHPEPANARMMNWARFLRNEADASSILKLDTTRSSIEECVFELLAVFDL